MSDDRILSKKRGLGRGLSALLSGGSKAEVQEEAVNELRSVRGEELREMPIEYLERGKYQPRHAFNQEQLEELANSIKAKGVLQPIVARSLADKRYEIVAGERRWRAAQLAGLTEIPVLVREIADEAAMEIALIENIQRENLNPIEEAEALKRLIDEFHITQEAVADAVGKSRTAVANYLRLLQLSFDVKKLLDEGALDMGHARALLALSGEQQVKVAHDVVARGLSVRETERLVRKLQRPRKDSAREITDDSNIRMLQNDLSERLGAKVTINCSKKGSGMLAIYYHSLDELEGILAHIK